MGYPASWKDKMDPSKQVFLYQRDLFELLDEFFHRATGESAQDFAKIDNFHETVSKEAKNIALKAKDAVDWADNELRRFYSRRGPSAFGDSKRIGGLKMVLGGSSRFQKRQFNSICNLLLYADTIFIPDPVLPWLEVGRQEERFLYAELLHAVFIILHLKELVDANLPYPALMVFPSFEKSLEEYDPQTHEGIRQLIQDIFTYYVDSGLSSLDDIHDYIRKEPDKFMVAVEKNRLLVAPGGIIDEPLPAALKRYEEYIVSCRTKEMVQEFMSRPIQYRVMTIITERLIPQYHILENCEELNSHPLLCIEQQAHYYKLVSRLNSARLTHLAMIDNKTNALIESLVSERLAWLSRIPMNTLVQLRMNNENKIFRTRLENAINRMHDSTIGDTDKVIAEVCHELDSAIGDYNGEIRNIATKYKGIHGKTAILAFATLGFSLFPSLAPYIGTAAPFAIAAKYAYDKITEASIRAKQAKSLMGVITVARDND